MHCNYSHLELLSVRETWTDDTRTSTILPLGDWSPFRRNHYHGPRYLMPRLVQSTPLPLFHSSFFSSICCRIPEPPVDTGNCFLLSLAASSNTFSCSCFWLLFDFVLVGFVATGVFGVVGEKLVYCSPTSFCRNLSNAEAMKVHATCPMPSRNFSS